MKRRFSSHTTLIELTAALLIFMLASVTILGLFMTAYAQSQEAERNTRALQLAQDCAAVISGAKDIDQMLSEMEYRYDNGAYVMQTEADMLINAVLTEEQTGVGILLDAQISVLCEEKMVLQLPVTRYYNKEVIHP